MLAEATGGNPPFRRVLVHDQGRLCRCEDELRELLTKLESNGVTVMSVTSPSE
jgi:DNA invertase Pin-like site-specific DNA recombinase